MKLFRRGISLVLALLLIFNLPFVNAFENGKEPTFVVSTAQGQQGDEQVTVNILAENNPGISSAKLSLSYDTERLKLESAKINNAWGGSTSYSPTIDTQPYILNWVLGTEEYTEANSTFATLTFSILENAPAGDANVNITYNPDDVYNLNFENINYAIQNGSITVLAAPMTQATVAVAAPQRGVSLADTVTCGSEAYSGQVVWYKGATASGQTVAGNAKSNTVYTAKITIMPGEAQRFADNVAVEVNDEAAENIAPDSDGNLVVTKTFPATADKDTPICTPPAGLTATYGQTLANVALTNPAGNTEGTWAWKNSSQSVGNAGTNSFKATFTPNDTENFAVVDDIDVSVTVGAKNVTPTITVEPAVYDYTGNAITPTKVVVKDGETVIAESEYSLSYQNNINAGTATVTVSDVDGGNYAITETDENFTIRQIPGTIEILNPATIAYDGTAIACGESQDLNFTYTGDGMTAVKWYADDAGVKGSEISAPTDAGWYWLGVSASAGINYEAVAEVTKRFEISPKNIADASITLGAAPTYDGSPKTITVSSVSVDGLTVTYGINSGSTGTDAGEYTLVIGGNGNFTGTAEKKWEISPASLASATFAPVDDQSFANLELTPKPSVMLGEKILTEGVDFTYFYSNNQYVGTATVNIRGMGNYAGEAAGTTFTIAPITDPASITATASVTKGGNTVDLSSNVTGALGTVSYSLTNGGGSVDAQGVYTSPAESGSAVVAVTIAGSDLNNDGINEYTGKTVDVTITITDKTVVSLDVTQLGCTFGNALPAAVYNEPAGTIATTKTYIGTTRSGDDYESAAAPTEAGTYTVKVVCETATQIFEGTSASFNIAPKSLDGAEIVLGTALTYNTQSQTQSVTAVNLGGVDILAFCDVTGNTATNAGQYTLTVTAKDNTNYTGTVQKAFTVGKKAITPTVEGVIALDYTGNQLTQSAVVVKDGTNVLTVSDYAIVYAQNITAGTDAGSLTVQAKENGNYSFSDVTVTFTINKITYPGETTMTSEARYGASQTVDLTPLLAEGYELGTVSVTSDNEHILEGMPSVTGTELTYALADVAENTGKTAAIQVQVSSTTNYLPYDVTITVTVIDKLEQSDFQFAESSKSMVYGETLSFPATGAVTGSSVTYSSSDPTVASVDGTGKVTALGVGDAVITASASATGEYAQASASYTLHVDKATVTVTAIDRSIYVGGTVPSLTAPAKGTDYNVIGLVGTDTLVGTLELKYQLNGEDVTPDQSKAGTYDIVISGVSEPDGGNYNPIVLSMGKLTIQTRPYTGGSNSTHESDTVKNEDGSVTTTVTNNATGTVTETTKYPDGSKTVVTTAKNGTKEIVTELPAAVVDAAQQKNGTVEVRVPDLRPANNTDIAAPVTIVFAGKNPINVKIVVEDVTSGTVAVIINDDGTEEIVKTSLPVKDGLFLTVEPSQTLKIVENGKRFVDVAPSSWYANNVAFVTARELFSGTSATQFIPNASMSRGMLATVLYRLEGEPEVAGTSFIDVPDGKYYSDAISWAAANDILEGYGNGKFGPDNPITREQLAVILWRYAGSPKSGMHLEHYTDHDKISNWALDAVRWAVEEGIITGIDDVTLSPQGLATRAQVAAILERFVRYRAR